MIGGLGHCKKATFSCETPPKVHMKHDSMTVMMRATNVNHLDMWRRLLTATLCATTAGGFDVPFAHRASVQAPCTPKLDSLATASSCSRVRCRRRPTRTATMMAGPNKGQKPAFFADWPVLEAELRSYLVEREAGEPKDDDRKPSPARNPMLNFLSIDPTGMALQDAPDADEWDGEIDALAYSELTRYGYGYLVEPMMNAGGYAVASELMGINLNSRTLKTREYYERMNPQQGLKENVELDGFLTLGRAREDRLDSVAEVDREERSKSLFEKQAMMDKVKKAEAKAAKPTFLSPRKVALGGRSQGDVDDEVFRPPGLPEDQRGPSQWIPPARDDSAPLQPLLLSLPQRANTVAVFFSCAVAFGRGTAGALEAGLLPQEVAEAAVPASLFLLGLNVASAAVGGSIAKGKGRSVPLWVFKGAVAGVTSVLELKGLPDLDPSAGLSASGAGAGERST